MRDDKKVSPCKADVLLSVAKPGLEMWLRCRQWSVVWRFERWRGRVVNCVDCVFAGAAGGKTQSEVGKTKTGPRPLSRLYPKYPDPCSLDSGVLSFSGRSSPLTGQKLTSQPSLLRPHTPRGKKTAGVYDSFLDTRASKQQASRATLEPVRTDGVGDSIGIQQ